MLEEDRMLEVQDSLVQDQKKTKTTGRYFVRFTRAQRAMHAVLFTTFLGLAATGLPLRFSESIWARRLASEVGGFGAILFFHKLCAIVLTIAFVLHVKEIFSRGIMNREKGIFWGATSMVANWKDVKDLFAHFRWFLGLGPKPKFERYAYWEKFDYWAVFWGMMVIIFSIHFVNTHLRPGSFPMDMVIFTGVESEEEFKHKRSVEYERLAAAGKLESRLGEKPASWLVNFGRVVGTIAITIGIVLLVLTLTAYFGE